MTSNSPEDIRRDIESTRRELSSDVDALTDKVSPKRVVERRVDRTKSAVTRAKEKVMGSSSSSPYGNGSRSGGLGAAGDRVSSAAGNVGGTVSDTASSVASAASSAPDQARARTQGNPLAAGLIAFGAGWLVSSILPATEKEKRAATAVKEKAQEHSDTIKAPLTEAANEVKDNLREPAQQAAQSVKSTAQEGVDSVKSDAQSAAGDVRGQARDSKEQVQDPSGGTTGGTTDLRDSVGSHPLG
jgi:gas vesicle protein